MSPSNSPSHTSVGSSESQVNVLESFSPRHQPFSPFRPALPSSPRHQTPSSLRLSFTPLIPSSLKKTPKTFQNTKQSPKIKHVRFFLSSPSTSRSITSPTGKTCSPYPLDTGYHYPGLSSPQKPPTRQHQQSFSLLPPQPTIQQTISTLSPPKKSNFIDALSNVLHLLDSESHFNTATLSTPAPVLRSASPSPLPPLPPLPPSQPSVTLFTPSPVMPGAPSRRQGITHPRFLALSAPCFVPASLSPSPLSRRVSAARLYRPMSAAPLSFSLSTLPLTPEKQTRIASIHKWAANLPTPHALSPVQPHQQLQSPSTSSSLSSSLFSSPRSPSPLPSPLPPPHRSPSPRASPVVAPITRRSPSTSDHLTDALSKLKALVEAGSPSPVVRSPSPAPVVALSPVIPCSPVLSRTPSPFVISIPPPPPPRVSSPVVSSPAPSSSHSSVLSHTPSPFTLSVPLPPPTRSLKRKLPQDASPPPRRLGAPVFRFEPPSLSFAPALPASLPSFPDALPAVPGAFPTNLRFEPTPHSPSSPSSSVSWKAAVGIAAGTFALGFLVSRFLF